MQKLIGDNPRDLAAWLDRQPDESLRISQIGSIAQLYGKADLHEALQWALDLPAKESGKALANLLPSAAKQSEHFAEEVVLGLVEPAAQVEAAASLLLYWSQDVGPEAAYEWSVANLSAAVRRESNGGLFVEWGRQDPVGAVATFEDISNVDERRIAGSSIAWGMVMGHYEDEPPQQRHERMVSLDRLYQGFLDIAPVNQQNDPGDWASYKLYHYWKDIDPDLSLKYKERAERYDGPTL